MSIYNKQKRTIYTVSAECGRGKTYATCQYIKNKLHMRNYLYVASTIPLLRQTEKELSKTGVSSTSIHSENCAGRVGGTIIEYLKKSREVGEVLLITWKSYSELEYFAKHHNWEIFIDELPQLDTQHFKELPDNHHFITEYLDIDEDNLIAESIAKVIPKNKDKLRYFLEKKATRDDVYGYFTDLFKDVLSVNKDVFVDLTSWNSVIETRGISKKYQGNRLYFLSLLNPKLFVNATLIGANIEHSMIYDWFKRFYNIKFKNNNKIRKKLLPVSNFASRLRISYIISGKQWSKSFRDTELKDGKSLQDAIDIAVRKIVGDSPFLLVANNDYKGNLTELPNCKQISVDSKGMNQYQNYTIIVHIPALNRKPKHFNMLNKLGFDAETIRVSTGYEVLYQNLMRTALRNKDSNEIVRLITASEYEANFLISLFGEGEKKRILDIEYKKYKSYTPSEKNQRSKYNKVKEQILSVVGEPLSTNNIETSQNDDYLSYIKKKGNQNGKFLTSDDNSGPTTVHSYLLTFHKSIKDKLSNNFIYEENDYTELKQILKDFSKTVIDDKDELFLINPSVYGVPDEGEGHRTYDNLEFSCMLILDFDNGDLSIKDFENIFWHDAGRGMKRSFIICNSFSRCKELPNRFRVFMPYIQPALTIEQHHAVYDSIMDRIYDAGYTKDSCGIDKCSRQPNQSFYIPSTNREHKDYKYFKAFGWKNEELNRCSINPQQYIRTAIDKPDRKIISILDAKHPKVNIEQKIQTIKNEYLAIPKGYGKRNNGFYLCGLKLSNYLSLPDVELLLRELAGNELKIIRRVPDTIKSIKKQNTKYPVLQVA